MSLLLLFRTRLAQRFTATITVTAVWSATVTADGAWEATVA